MNWCEGSLRDRLAPARKVPVENATMILCDLVEGLIYARNKEGVVHLDLKPENVLYMSDLRRMLQYAEGDDRRYRFMLSDWGIASIKQGQLNSIAKLPPASELSLQTFNNIGTLRYMAPERFIDGYRSSIASDLFSLGMIYLEMLTGFLPFDATIHPVESLITGAYFKNAAKLLESAAISPMLWPLVVALLMPDPLRRPESYEELKTLISACYRMANGTFSADVDLSSSPFDVAASRNTAIEEFARWEASPEVEHAFVSTKKGLIQKVAANLRSVSRGTEATEIVENYLGELFAQWEGEPDNPNHLILVANAAITLENLETGKRLLKIAITRSQTDAIPLDLGLP